VLTAFAQEVHRMHQHVGAAAGGVVNAVAGARLKNAHQGVHHFRWGEKLARLRACVVGNLLDEILVGAAKNIGRHAGVEKVVPIFTVLDNEKRGELPPPPDGHWSEYSTVAERDFRFAAAAKLAITKSRYFLVGADAIEGWGLPRPRAIGRKFRPSC
jgi:hypothetical protein